MPNLSEKLSGLTYTPKPLSPMRAGCIVNVASDSVAEWTSRNWFECDGSEYPEATYADLFAAIGTKYNTGGETASHFRVPNGPRETDWVDLSFSGTPAGWSVNEAKGKVTKTLNGQYELAFYIDATVSATSSNVTVIIDGIAPATNQSVTIYPASTGNAASATISPTGQILRTTTGSTGGFRISGNVRLSSIPSDLFVSNDSRFSTVQEAMSSIPVIKIYNDEGTVSVSSAAATASTLGTVKLNSEYAATSSQYGLALQPNGILRLNTGNGHGSTGNKIRRFSNITEQSGDAFTYVDSATDGMSVTANRDMMVAVTYDDSQASGGWNHGISLNSSQLSTVIPSINITDRITFVSSDDGRIKPCPASFRVNTGDVVRAHTNGTPDNTSANCNFMITEMYRFN